MESHYLYLHSFVFHFDVYHFYFVVLHELAECFPTTALLTTYSLRVSGTKIHRAEVVRNLEPPYILTACDVVLQFYFQDFL